MKKALCCVIVCIVGVLVMGCASTVPVFYSNNSNTEYEILGRVVYEGTIGMFGEYEAGFTNLLNAAKKKYPECDFVIDVTIDKEARLLFGYMMISGRYIMQGTAVKYVSKL
jgi:hypothetical protein